METFTFNGIYKSYLSVLRGSNRPSWAPVERVYQEAANRSGAFLNGKRKTKSRELPIPVVIKSDNLKNLQKVKEDLAAWLIHDETKPLIFDDEPDRHYYAVVDGAFDIDEVVRLGQGIITFVCPDPFKYGEEIKISSTTIFNAGTAPSNIVLNIEFTAAAIEFRIQNEEGKYVRIIWAFAAGDKLEIDFKKRKVTINHMVRMTSLDIKSTWFDLKAGENKLEVTPNGVAGVSVAYTPRWL
ncbi:distal tail protein Dit [Niallia taxi]|uniref:distal tail protein Dit n=1 Tax=Niallia taxi TaxID=2499688 RepID=UPI003F5D7E84